MSYVRVEEDANPQRLDNLALAYRYMQIVYDQHKEQLGPEHHYILLAKLYLARTKSEMGLNSEAEAMIVEGLKIAERNIPKEHIALLMAKTMYAQVLSRLKKYAEAESIFYSLTDKAKYRQLADEDGDHPDRLSTLWLLEQCLEDQGKLEEALHVCEEFQAGLAAIGGQGAGMKHKIRLKVQEKIPQLQGRSGTMLDSAKGTQTTLAKAR
jgi:tetratricopeptide (TPR) repeat protein